MEWTKLLEGALGSSPIAVILGYVSYNLWGKLAEKDRIIGEKDLLIQKLSQDRVNDLKSILSPNG